jgi:diketogulonate reductase-like aldo/keto reductase
MMSAAAKVVNSAEDIESRAALNDGHNIPWFGLGVYKAEDTEDAVYTALKEGYRHIDTAELYQNEQEVGRGLRRFCAETGVSRSEIYITTKFWPSGKAGNAVREALESSLRKLELDYVDLYLIHAPVDRDLRLQQWESMEVLKDEGLTKSIGVSNYGIHHLQELLAHCKYRPVVNQIEINPYIARPQLANFCKSVDIAVEAWAPLTKVGRQLW